MADTATAKRHYEEQGLSPLPLKPLDKRPAIPSGWTSLPMPIDDSHWHADCNIGLRMDRHRSGLAVVAIDIDGRPACKDPVMAATRWMEQETNKAIIGNTPFIRSGNGIKILLLCDLPENASKVPEKEVNSEINIGCYVGSGCQIMAPPSIHPDTKQPNEWVKSGLVKVITPAELATLCPHVTDASWWQGRRSVATCRYVAPTSQRLTPEPSPGESAIDYAKRAPKSIDGDKGGGTTLGVLQWLHRLAKSDEEFAEAADYYNEHRCSPPWRGNEWTHKIKDSAKSAEQHLNGNVVMLPAGSLPRSQDTILTVLDAAGVVAKRNWRATRDVLIKILPESPLAAIGSLSDSNDLWQPLSENFITALRAWAEEHVRIEGNDKDDKPRPFKITPVDIEAAIKSFAKGVVNPPADAFKQWLEKHGYDPDWHRFMKEIWCEIIEANVRPGVDGSATNQAAEEIVRLCARAIVLGIITRTIEVGYKLDESVILIGCQGSGKSIFSQLICPTYRSMGLYHPRADARPHCTIDDMSGTTKEMAEVESDKMVVEFGELSGMHKACISKLKAHLTANELTYRPAYGRETIKQPRTSVFIGTSNQAEGSLPFDVTGNRRLITLLLGKDIRSHLSEDPAIILTEERLQQIFGSAYHDYLQGERPNMPRQWVKTTLAEISQDYTPDIPVKEWIENAANTLEERGKAITHASIMDVWDEWHSRDNKRRKSVSAITFGQIMHEIGYTRKRVRLPDGSRPRRWIKG